jgi:FSR family fosmidomycin resistance protein-like MFS transporter
MHYLQIFTISLGHLITDTAQGAIPLFLPYLKDIFSLSYFQVGLIMLFSSITSSIIQPLFGFLSDKHQSLWLLPVGSLLAMVGIGLIGIVPNYYFVLIVVAISGLGVASYHPEASKAIFYLSGTRKATAMSLFSVGGNLGFAIGPIIATFLIGLYGFKGSLGFMVLGIFIGGLLLYFLPTVKRKIQTVKEATEIQVDNKTKTRKFVITFPIILLMLIVTIRSWIHLGLSMTIPLYYIDYLGMNPVYGSSLLSTFLLCGAVGTLLGGPIADRIGLKPILYFSFFSALPLMYLLFHSHGFYTYIFTALVGISIIITFSITTVYAQKLMPENIGLASGLVLGFAIGTGGIGTTLLGLIADNLGLTTAINFLIVLPIAAILLVRILPRPGEHAQTKSIRLGAHTKSQS